MKLLFLIAISLFSNLLIAAPLTAIPIVQSNVGISYLLECASLIVGIFFIVAPAIRYAELKVHTRITYFGIAALAWLMFYTIHFQ